MVVLLRHRFDERIFLLERTNYGWCLFSGPENVIKQCTLPYASEIAGRGQLLYFIKAQADLRRDSSPL